MIPTGLLCLVFIVHTVQNFVLPDGGRRGQLPGPGHGEANITQPKQIKNKWRSELLGIYGQYFLVA